MTNRPVEAGLLTLQAIQVTFILLHDWVPLGRLSNLPAVRGSDTHIKLFWTTILSALPFALVFGVCCKYGLTAWPMWLHTWLWYTYAVAFAGALMAWWIPYLIRPDPVRAKRYRVRFDGTLRFLPERNGISPDALHVFLHLCMVATLVLLMML